MKLIQKRELDRICIMIKGDQEMRDLAVKLLTKKEKVRLSWTTILIIHAVAFLISLTVVISACIAYKLGLMLIPVITGLLFQVIFSTMHCILVWNVRKQYNRDMKVLSHG